jgi:hypothetical protein
MKGDRCAAIKNKSQMLSDRKRTPDLLLRGGKDVKSRIKELWHQGTFEELDPVLPRTRQTTTALAKIPKTAR